MQEENQTVEGQPEAPIKLSPSQEIVALVVGKSSDQQYALSIDGMPDEVEAAAGYAHGATFIIEIVDHEEGFKIPVLLFDVRENLEQGTIVDPLVIMNIQRSFANAVRELGYEGCSQGLTMGIEYPNADENLTVDDELVAEEQIVLSKSEEEVES